MLAATLRYRVIQRQQIAELSNTKKVRFNDIFDTGNKKKAAMVNREPTTNQRENFDKFTAPNNNIIQCFFGQLGGLLLRSKERGTLDISREERSNKCFRIDGSKVCIFTFFLFASQSSINTHSYQ